MSNIFYKIEEELFFREDIIFDEEKIKEFIFNYLNSKINLKEEKQRPFYFEEVIYDFFEYLNIELIKTKKTRDSGIDGIVKIKLSLFGEISLGLQIKYKLINSNDVDIFLSSLKNAELQLGAIICKDSRRLEKYQLNSKIKAILLSKGIEIKEKLINDRIDINPVYVLKLNEIVDIVTSQMRGVIKSIYKK